MDAISLSQRIVQTDPSPNDKVSPTSLLHLICMLAMQGGPVGPTTTTKVSPINIDNVNNVNFRCFYTGF